MQRSFEPIRKQGEAWQRSELTDVTAKVIIYEAFVEGKLEGSQRHLAERCTISTSNRITATAMPGEFLEAWFSQSF